MHVCRATIRWILVLPSAVGGFVAAVGIAVVTGSLFGKLSAASLPWQAALSFDGFVAATLVVGAGALCAPRFRVGVALTLFAAGALSASLLFGREVWPQSWWPYLLTLCGGAFAVAVVIRLDTQRGLAAVVAAVALVLVVGGLGFARSYRDVNRGASSVLFAKGEFTPPLFFRRNDPGRGLHYVRVVRSRDKRSGTMWTWTQPVGFDWNVILRADTKVRIDLELDLGSGPSYVCASAVDTAAARVEVERLIDARWAMLAKGAVIRPPRANLQDAVPIQLEQGVHCERPVAANMP